MCKLKLKFHTLQTKSFLPSLHQFLTPFSFSNWKLKGFAWDFKLNHSRDLWKFFTDILWLLKSMIHKCFYSISFLPLSSFLPPLSFYIFVSRIFHIYWHSRQSLESETYPGLLFESNVTCITFLSLIFNLSGKRGILLGCLFGGTCLQPVG